jgi:hypothetical protein
LAPFRGEIDQTPPIYSALKHQGQPLYRLARQGLEIERASRRVSILNLCAAAVLFVEWYARWSAGGKLVSPPLVSGIVTLALAFLHPFVQRRIRAKWSLRMDDDGILIRAGRFRRAAARWSELRAVDATRDAVRLVTMDGREQRIHIRLAENRDELAAAVTEAARRRAIAAGP